MLLHHLLLCCLFAFNEVRSANFVKSVIASKPISYFRLEALNGTSEVNSYSYRGLGEVKQIPGAPIGEVNNNALHFTKAGKGFVNTTLSGKVAAAGSIMAWVNLDDLPSQGGKEWQCIAGESQRGNDFDLLFNRDDRLYWYCGSGQYISYQPNVATLADNWHMIVATMEKKEGKGIMSLYWDGVPVTVDNSAPVSTGKNTAFFVGQSSLWEDRFFNGGIDEVALWSRALSFLEVWNLHQAAQS